MQANTPRPLTAAVPTISGFSLERMIALVRLWHQRHQGRKALAYMDAEQLDDLGISAREAQIEAEKPFWR